VLPAGKRIEFQIASADVIHAFWVPEFLFKRDVMPDPEANHSVNVFQVTEITKTGEFVGRCAEMCGTYHSMMNFEVRAVLDDFATCNSAAPADQLRSAHGHQPTAACDHYAPVRHAAWRQAPPERDSNACISARLSRSPRSCISATACGVLTGLFSLRRHRMGRYRRAALSGGLSLITGTFFRSWPGRRHRRGLRGRRDQ
jgi:hypothetical protein